MKPLLVLLIQFSLTKLFALMRWVLHGFRSRGPGDPGGKYSLSHLGGES